MKYISIATLTLLALLLSGCASAPITDMEKYSLIEDNVNVAWGDKVTVQQIDKDFFFLNRDPKNVAPGNHSIGVSICDGNCTNSYIKCNGSCRDFHIKCNTLAGYRYEVTRRGCSNKGRRMDFANAADYWAKIDADPYKRVADIDAVNKEAQEIEQNNRAIYLEEQKRQEAAKQAAIQLNSFRNSLAAGSETNCGPVIEVKGDLLKISHAVAEYGNEHWIRRYQLFPPSYGCRFHRGEYQPPQ